MHASNSHYIHKQNRVTVAFDLEVNKRKFSFMFYFNIFDSSIILVA